MEMVDSSEKFVELNSSEFKDEIFIKDEFVIEEEVVSEWIGDNEIISESLKDVGGSKPISICLEAPILEDFKQDSDQSQLLNIAEANWKKIECPKCKLMCENHSNFLFHYQSCKSQDDIHSCKKCSYQCKDISMLNFHTQLMHSSGQVVINIDKINDPQKKCVNLTLQREIPEKIVLSVKSSNTKDNNDFVEKNNIEEPLLSQDQTNSVEKDDRKCPIAKVCNVCNITITTKIIVTDRCKTCNNWSMFRCNQCNKLFSNYQKVSQHLWSECVCLDCDYRSPYKLGVRCDRYHPVPALPTHEEDKSIKKLKHVAKLKELQKCIQFIIWYCPTCKKETKLKSSIISSYIQSCTDCNSNMWIKCARCKKIYRKWHELPFNHLRNSCYKRELREDEL